MEVKARRIDSIPEADVRSYLSLKETERLVKRRLEMVQSQRMRTEAALIARVQQGYPLDSNRYALKLNEVEQRYPDWEEHFVSVAGRSTADQVLGQTEPDIQTILIVEVL